MQCHCCILNVEDSSRLAKKTVKQTLHRQSRPFMNNKIRFIRHGNSVSTSLPNTSDCIHSYNWKTIKLNAVLSAAHTDSNKTASHSCQFMMTDNAFFPNSHSFYGERKNSFHNETMLFGAFLHFKYMCHRMFSCKLQPHQIRHKTINFELAVLCLASWIEWPNKLKKFMSFVHFFLRSQLMSWHRSLCAKVDEK